MSTRQGRMVGLALAVMMLACSEPTAPEPGRSDSTIPGPRELTLGVGDELAVGESVLRVSFEGVPEDSRCPTDVQCVWEGNAVVELGIRAGMGPTHPLTLNTSREPRSVRWNQVKVILLDLRPDPNSSAPIRADDYVVDLRIEPVS